jgi:hypothetical protein
MLARGVRTGPENAGVPFDPETVRPLNEELEVFRLTRTDDHDSPEWLKSFRSRRALGLPPRPRTEEAANALLMDGVSVSRDEAKLRKDALRVRKRKPHLGGALAKLRIRPDPGIRIAEWGPPGHLTIWAPAERLASAVVDTLPIED